MMDKDDYHRKGSGIDRPTYHLQQKRSYPLSHLVRVSSHVGPEELSSTVPPMNPHPRWLRRTSRLYPQRLVDHPVYSKN